MSNLFEYLAATDDSAALATRKASAVANKRVKDAFGPFFANAATRADLGARIALVEDDISGIVNAVVSEYGGNAETITAAIKRSLDMMPGGGGMPGAMPGAMPGGMGAGMGMPGQAPGGAGGGTCPQCHGPMVNGQCPTCQGGHGVQGAPAQGAPAPGGMPGIGGAFNMTHGVPQPPTSGPIQAAVTSKGGFCDECKTWKHKGDCNCEAEKDAPASSESPGDAGGADAGGSTTSSFQHVARRPKLCPYHSEVVDVSLGAGDPQAGFNAMSAHAWGEQHCKGNFEGSCNFRPAMVTQKYWDDKRTEYDERRQQRELDRLTQPDAVPELSIDTEPIMHAEPLADEPGKEGVTDIDGELENAPSAVGGGELSMAASTKEAEALKTVKLPKGGESALGGPSPKIDKGNSGDQNGWSLDPIDTDMDGTPHPTREQDPTAKADFTKDNFLDQTRAVTETVELDSAPDMMNDAGFAPGGEEHGPHTDTWTGTDGMAKPVTRESLSAANTDCELCESRVPKGDTKVVDGLRLCADCRGSDTPDAKQTSDLERESAIDPDKNPIQELMDEYSGFMMPNEITAAVRDWDVG